MPFSVVGGKRSFFSLSIPATLLITVLVLNIRGSSLNLLTLSGLILGIGMVVDNAILIVSRIDELMATNASRLIAASRAAGDVLRPLLTSAVTNACIFLPVAFLDGSDSFTDILRAFQLPIIASLGAWLIVALTFIPIATIHWRGKAKSSGVADNNPHDGAPSEKLVRSLRWIQKHQTIFAWLTVALVLGIGRLVVEIPQSDIEAPRDAFSSVNVQFAPEVPPAERMKLFSEVESTLLKSKGETLIGSAVSNFNPDFVTGTIMVYPRATPDKDEELTAQEKRLKAFLANYPPHPGLSVNVGWSQTVAGQSRRQDTYRVSGAKSSRINEILENLRTKVTTVPGVETVHLDRDEGGNETLVFIPNDVVLSQYGLTLQQVSGEISANMISASIGNVNVDGKTVAANISVTPPGGSWTSRSLQGS